MQKKHKLIKTDFKCPECGRECLYDVDLDLFVCNRPLINGNSGVKGSCGKFYMNKIRAKQ
jgi:transcription elongation factor Elf1